MPRSTSDRARRVATTPSPAHSRRKLAVPARTRIAQRRRRTLIPAMPATTTTRLMTRVVVVAHARLSGPLPVSRLSPTSAPVTVDQRWDARTWLAFQAPTTTAATAKPSDCPDDATRAQAPAAPTVAMRGA
jgi:hypothetical protein